MRVGGLVGGRARWIWLPLQMRQIGKPGACRVPAEDQQAQASLPDPDVYFLSMSTIIPTDLLRFEKSELSIGKRYFIFF